MKILMKELLVVLLLCASLSAWAGISGSEIQNGTWLPTLGGTTTYTKRVGFYQKIQKRVLITFDLVINAIGTGNTSNIFGLPFPAESSSTAFYYCVLSLNGSATAIVSVNGYVPGALSQIVVEERTAAQVSEATTTLIASGSAVIGSCDYFTN